MMVFVAAGNRICTFVVVRILLNLETIDPLHVHVLAVPKFVGWG